MRDDQLRVLAVTNMYPTERDPGYGAFVAVQMEWVARVGASVRVEFVNGRRSRSAYLAAVGRVRRLATAMNFDVVHAHYGLVGLVSAFQPLPLVVSFCGDDLLGTPDSRDGITLKSRVERWLSRRSALRADAIICKSEGLRAALPREKDRARAHVIPNGVDTTLFFPGDRAGARRRLGLEASERLILFPHTAQVPRKRFDLAVASVERLLSLGLTARLLVVNGVPHREMPDYYRAADCLLLTSDQEGSPNAVKEALCCDLPVVTVDVGDVSRWIALAPGSRMAARDPDAIAQAVNSVLCSGTHVDGTFVRAEASAETVGRRLLEVYRTAISRRYP